MLEILVYIFENYMEYDTNLRIPEEEVTTSLRGEGYFSRDIQQALAWLTTLNNPASTPFRPEHTFVMRHYSINEKCCFGKKGLAFLSYLQRTNIIDAATREVIIERAMALWRSQMPLRYLKWVTLIVLFSRNADRKNMLWMQDLILHDQKTQAIH